MRNKITRWLFVTSSAAVALLCAMAGWSAAQTYLMRRPVSGLSVVAAGPSLPEGCGDGQIAVYSSGNWICGDDATGGGIGTITTISTATGVGTYGPYTAPSDGLLIEYVDTGGDANCCLTVGSRGVCSRVGGAIDKATQSMAVKSGESYQFSLDGNGATSHVLTFVPFN